MLFVLWYFGLIPDELSASSLSCLFKLYFYGPEEIPGAFGGL